MGSENTPAVGQDIIQTLRTAHQNQTQLNLMADQKANILIGTLVVVFTVVLTRLLTLQNGVLIYPIVVFALMQLVPLVLSTLVLIPKNIRQTKSKRIEDMANPLFFGCFTKFSETEYEQFLLQKLTSNSDARALLIHDLYQIGCILKRKYTLLRLAYIFAVLGVVVPVFYLLIVLLSTAAPL
ncbi:Pycsar system effector family protein [Marinicella sp. W31]|uniref:Pycsar system effector family protein n=1 Tax=Marinicella sp. W31 TaxID=3023713 RepID=UPI003757B3DE